MKNHSYRISWLTFALALTSVALIPGLLFLTDDGQPGWDQLSEQLNIVFGGLAMGFLFLTVSFISGLFALQQRKMALLWVVPGGLLVMLVVAYLAAYLAAWVWYADWL